MDQESDKETTKTFSEDYVKELREEAAKHRTEKNKLKEEMSGLTTKLNDLTDKFSTIDTDEYQSLKEEKAELLKKQKEAEREQMKKQGEFDKLIEQTKQEMLDEFIVKESEFKTKIDSESIRAVDLENKVKELEARYEQTVLRHAVVAAAAKEECINPELIELMIDKEITIDRDDNGNALFYFKDDSGEVRKTEKGKPFTVADRIAEMKQSESFAPLFRGATNGGGSQTKEKGDTVDNPWKKETFNMTKQVQLIKSNREMAIKLAAEAGIKL